jgi:hypothetical protein
MLEHSTKSHALRKTPTPVRRRDSAPPQWPSYSGVSQYVGTSLTGRVTVYVDASLGQPALQNAQDLMNDADRVVAANDAVFGTTGGPVSVIVFAMDGNTDGTGGADHMGCDYTTGAAIEVCASFGNSARVSALFEAELSECSMGGNLCGLSTGEALSRWCAAEIGDNALSDFATAPTWAESRKNFVDRTDPTDGNAISTGCGMAFLSWLISQGYALNSIAPAMVSLGDSGTLAQLYAKLTGDAGSNAWPKFTTAVNALPDGVTSDDPFGEAPHAAQIAHLNPLLVELSGKLLSAILTDISDGKSAQQIVASVEAILASKPSTVHRGASAAACQMRSRRLLPPSLAPGVN